MSDTCHHMSPQNLQVSSFHRLWMSPSPWFLWIAVIACPGCHRPSAEFPRDRNRDFPSRVETPYLNLKNKIDQDRSASVDYGFRDFDIFFAEFFAFSESSSIQFRLGFTHCHKNCRPRFTHAQVENDTYWRLHQLQQAVQCKPRKVARKEEDLLTFYIITLGERGKYHVHPFSSMFYWSIEGLGL